MVGMLRTTIGNRGEIALVVAMVGILIVLFTPIPAPLLDFLLLLNFSLGLTVLLLTFYTEKPLAFSTFPSILLIATLLRLSLNIASTRLILEHADAGRVIDAIGTYVIGGNYVIGLVVFLILIVVQYIVVTNGAQRVAEVAARFTLDSMPGKQMSIDADMNMGLIDEHEARDRRLQIEREGNFYGAMDGASKFVKGDAIAGIIIVLINIIGGLAIGIVQHGMGWSEALQTYTLLTVGDGIVTQIPALVMATATGIIVTRAATDAQLGEQIVNQLTEHPKTFVMLGIALLVALVLPGIPAFPILMLLVGVGVLGAVAWRRRHGEPAMQESSAAGSAEEGAESEELYSLLAVDPVEVAVGQELLALVGETDGQFVERVQAFRKKLALELGLVIPTVRLRDNKRLARNSYRISIFGTKVGEGVLYPNRILAIDPSGGRVNLEGIQTKDPSYGLPASWLPLESQSEAAAQGYTVVDPLTVLVTHFSELMRQNSAALLTRAETERLVNRVRTSQAGLVEELIPAVLGLSDVQRVLQQLLREKVSIRNIEFILEVLVDQGKVSRDPDHLTEAVRQKLGGQICQSLTNDAGELHVLTLDPALEQAMASSIRAVDDKTSLVLEPKFMEQIVTALAGQAEKMLGKNLMPVLLCSPSLRRHAKALTERILPHLSVLSLSEVPTTVSVKAFGMVRI
ncbi:MAG TPA: flagellar biosynthesis protein FlhA [Gammaproteobacteria bacterium]|nr:flagellar biosynthesis protein FlhA [Gammaproteobacteria bacterium]